jgi:hypothetical protein
MYTNADVRIDLFPPRASSADTPMKRMFRQHHIGAGLVLCSEIVLRQPNDSLFQVRSPAYTRFFRMTGDIVAPTQNEGYSLRVWLSGSLCVWWVLVGWLSL